MRKTRAESCALALVTAVLLALAGAGCAETQAEPLQLTYYYLPG